MVVFRPVARLAEMVVFISLARFNRVVVLAALAKPYTLPVPSPLTRANDAGMA